MSIPCFYYPTTVAFVDDNRAMLDNLSLNIASNLSYKLYENSEDAFVELNSQPSLALDCEFIHKNDIDFDDDMLVKINLDAIRKLASNPQRFSYITALVVDYSMPKLNGLDLCKRIKSKTIRKIMLTGEAGPTLAIEAFNEGIIDQFIVKAAPNMQSHLKDSIQNAQWDFFIKQSENILSILKTQSECALFEPAYQALIKSFFNKHFPCEFYLIDQTGSFLFIDEDGEFKWIIIKSERELKNYYEIALDYSRAHPLSSDLLNNLKQFTKIPFLFSEDHHLLQIGAWSDYMHTATLLKGGDVNYYYTIIRGKGDYLNDLELANYSEYLRVLTI